MESKVIKGGADIAITGPTVEGYTPEVVVRLRLATNTFEVLHPKEEPEMANHYLTFQKPGNWSGPQLAALAQTLLHAAEVGQNYLNHFSTLVP